MRTGRAIGLYGSSGVAFSKGKFIGNGGGVGLTMAGSSNIGVSAAAFSNLRLGIGVTASSNVRISSSRFTAMPGDGINIAGSHYVTATSNTCSGGQPAVGAHPDCIQLWSLRGTAVQSDITLSKNIVRGPTQGITSFTPANGGGLRISIIDNIIATSFPQGIACYGCVDSIITGNQLSTLQGAQWRTSMNIVGGGNNFVANNTIGAKPASSLPNLSNLSSLSRFSAASENDTLELSDETLPDFVREDIAYLAESGIDINALSRTSGDIAAFNAIPEPATWAQLIFGFALTGLVARRRVAARIRTA